MVICDSKLCVRCGKCIRDCVVNILEPGPDGVPVMRPENEKLCIQCQHCLAICPAGAVACAGKTAENCAPAGNLPGEGEMLNLIRQRRSIRQYKMENLDRETMDKLKEMLHWTATGCNDHRLFFTVVEERKEMDVFRQRTSNLLKLLFRLRVPDLFGRGYRRFLGAVMNGEDVVFRGAPHMIVAASPKRASCAKIDPVIALSNFDLYAQTLGVGTCWCGFAAHLFHLDPVQKRRLNLPRGYRIGYVLLFGKPDVSYTRATAPEPYRFHRLK